MRSSILQVQPVEEWSFYKTDSLLRLDSNQDSPLFWQELALIFHLHRIHFQSKNNPEDC